MENLELILTLTAIAVGFYLVLTIVEKILIKRKAKKVMQNDDRTSNATAGADDNK